MVFSAGAAEGDDDGIGVRAWILVSDDDDDVKSKQTNVPPETTTLMPLPSKEAIALTSWPW